MPRVDNSATVTKDKAHLISYRRGRTARNAIEVSGTNERQDVFILYVTTSRTASIETHISKSCHDNDNRLAHGTPAPDSSSAMDNSIAPLVSNLPYVKARSACPCPLATRSSLGTRMS